VIGFYGGPYEWVRGCEVYFRWLPKRNLYGIRVNPYPTNVENRVSS